MTGRLVLLTSLVVAMSAHPAAAYAAPGDPAAGSPSGSVYELPFEKGRADAAPKSNADARSDSAGRSGKGGVGGTGSNGGETSYYRSENNFGSSSQVPGAPNFASGVGSGTGGSGSGGGIGAAAGSGGGSGSDPSGAVAAGTATDQLVDTGNTSTAGSLALLAIIAIVAGAMGYATLRARRPHAGY